MPMVFVDDLMRGLIALQVPRLRKTAFPCALAATLLKTMPLVAVLPRLRQPIA